MHNHEATIDLTTIDLLAATGLVLFAAAISLYLRLHLERKLVWASIRTVVQLLLVGYVLKWVFEINSPWVLLPVMGVMVLAASRAAVQRVERKYRGFHRDAFITLVLSGILTTLVVTQGIIGVTPWYKPQYLIPLLGMMLGNSLTGISLCLDVLLERLRDQRELIEMELALGATRWEAARDSLRQAVGRGMVPIINSMMVVGLVSLPGMMTGQILAGNSPMDAVKYQIVVMFMIAAATSSGCILGALLAYRRLFNHDHQLLWDEISKKS